MQDHPPQQNTSPQGGSSTGKRPHFKVQCPSFDQFLDIECLSQSDVYVHAILREQSLHLVFPQMVVQKVHLMGRWYRFQVL